ncbi:MAG TPA: DUF6049 family protein [Dermatophilaceae bacterium]|nr:DUF6049 family protein [Dermatophilaceae bacterium]
MTHSTMILSRRRVRRLAACAALLAVSVSPTVASWSPAMAAGAVTDLSTAEAFVTAPPVTGPAVVTLASVSPEVAVPRAPVTISGTIRNIGSVPIGAPIVRVLIGDHGLTSRTAVSEWSNPAGERFVGEVARIPLAPSLAPDAVAAFTLVVPATAISHRESFAVLPVSVDVVGTTSDAASQEVVLGSQHTFLPTLSAIKAYEPLSIAWLVPLTLDPDPALFGVDSAARTAAWTKAVGPGSRLDRVMTGTDSTQVTWAIDPAVLGPPREPVAPDASTTPAPAPTTFTTPAPTQGSDTPMDPVAEATTALATRIRMAAPRHTIWSLPYADPDLAALLPLPSGAPALEALISRPSALDATVGSTRKGIAWPVDGALTTPRENQLRQAYSSSGLDAAVMSTSTRTSHSGYTDDASRKSTGGLPLLAYDQGLSQTFAQTSTIASGAITTQLFLADSLALLGERPGTRSRSVLVAAPRNFAGDPGVLGSFFAAIAKAPWLTPTTTDQLLAAAGTAAPDAPELGTSVTPSPPTTSPTTSPAPPDPLSPGRSPLTQAMLQNMSRTTLAIDGVASIRDDTESFRVRWTDTQEQVLSSRWRGHSRGVTVINAATQSAINAVSRGVNVVPSSVNFFANRGVLQITVVNDLAIPVHDVHLTLNPGQQRLRIDQQAGPLRIGANSRANVKLHVTAVAAGLVPIQAVLTTSNGTPLGQDAKVNVHVQPTSTWIYWVLVGLASIILVLGVYRSLRRGTTRASRPLEEETLPDE